MATPKRKGKNQISLPRALSKLGVGSRTQATELIREGKIRVNGDTVRSPGLWVDLRVDRIELNGKALRKRQEIYVVMNKPAGVITTRSDDRERQTVYDLLPAEMRWVFPVGRLDMNTSGLLLLTNDTQFGERITNPDTKIPKTYETVVDKPLAFSDKQRMESGMVLDGTPLLPARIRYNDAHPCRFELTIVEGKNRQVRRMCHSLGYNVITLTRVRIGPIMLGTLESGRTRTLTDRELARMHALFGVHRSNAQHHLSDR